jgi:hypothetical protein
MALGINDKPLTASHVETARVALRRALKSITVKYSWTRFPVAQNATSSVDPLRHRRKRAASMDRRNPRACGGLTCRLAPFLIDFPLQLGRMKGTQRGYDVSALQNWDILTLSIQGDRAEH